ncbi:MAG: DCC1-like thiol-disulfide oxidoreductase family protein [Flavobacteriaceae bacterium]|nr:DCC1-like thiol-disulfide oxidoreductase family protein [Flavobacteriaceae bacterium]
MNNIKDLPHNKKLILFDGVCNLCNFWVQYIIKRDRNDVFRFAPLQSEIIKVIENQFNVDLSKVDSIVYYSETSGLTVKSDAVIDIAKNLGYPYKLLSLFSILPKKVRNSIYDFIARNRYKWYGKKDSCMVPTPELQKKFLV